MSIKENVAFPPVPKPEGKIKIELFDDLTGKKVEEIKNTNFIAKGMDTYYKILMISEFTRNKPTGGTTYSLNNMFERMSLTDADHAEQPNAEWLRRGREIGYALTSGTYSGNDDFRGSYNSQESFTTPEQVHIVVDFPTHAANGTFSSIYFTENSSPNDFNFDLFPRPFLNEGAGVLKAVQYNNEVWVLHSTSTRSSTSANTRNHRVSRYDSELNLLETYSLPDYKRDFEIFSNYIYYVDDIQSRAIMRAPISDPTNLTTVITSGLGENNDEYASGIVFDNKLNQFVVGSSNTSGSSSYSNYSSSISRYDSGFNLLSVARITNFDNTDSTSEGYQYQKLTFSDEVGVLMQSSNASRQYIVHDSECHSHYGGHIVGFIDDYKVMRDGTIMPKVGISSRSLLDSPVTKTSNNTMKITYDFMLPPLV